MNFWISGQVRFFDGQNHLNVLPNFCYQLTRLSIPQDAFAALLVH